MTLPEWAASRVVLALRPAHPHTPGHRAVQRAEVAVRAHLVEGSRAAARAARPAATRAPLEPDVVAPGPHPALAISALTAAVVILAADDYGASTSSAPAATAGEFRLPSHARIHGGAPVPDLSVSGRDVRVTPDTRYDRGAEQGSPNVAPTQPRPTEEQTFPGLARQGRGLPPHGPL